MEQQADTLRTTDFASHGKHKAHSTRDRESAREVKRREERERERARIREESGTILTILRMEASISSPTLPLTPSTCSTIPLITACFPTTHTNQVNSKRVLSSWHSSVNEVLNLDVGPFQMLRSRFGN